MNHLAPGLARLTGVVFLGSALVLAADPPPAPAAAPGPIRIVVVTGGHDYETNQFQKLLSDIPQTAVVFVAHPTPQNWLKADSARSWDVLVLYDLWQDITDEEKGDLVARLKEGKGLVALHHSLANYQAWPEYEHILGGRYNLQKRTVDNREHPASTYQHDVDFHVKVVNPQHPVTQGVADFDIRDETYGLFDVGPQAHVLLSTEEPTNGRSIAWARNYEAARVVYLQLGHDHQAYDNPNYRRLAANAIRWTAKRD